MFIRIALISSVALIASIILVIILGDKISSGAFIGAIIGSMLTDWWRHKDNYFGK